MKNTKKKVLVADDEPNIRSLVKRVLEKEYEVLEAKNGEEVFELAIRHIPSIIFLDIMMPKTDGLTALNKLKNEKSTSSIPVIMLTGANHELNEQLTRDLGAHAYLRKPVTPWELLFAVSNTV
ncbi:two-component system response regulator [Chloroflexota bacterium]